MTQIATRELTFKVQVPIRRFRRTNAYDRIEKIAKLAGTGHGGVPYRTVPTRRDHVLDIEVVASGNVRALDRFRRMMTEEFPNGKVV